MTDLKTTIRGFSGEIVEPGHAKYDDHRVVWNAMFDRRPGLIARCTSADDVAAAIRHARDAGLEIAVKCGGHSVLGLSVSDGGLTIDLSPMGDVRVDAERRLAWVEGGAILRTLDQASHAHGLATTAGNVSHTGVAGLTLGGGMGWLARQLGLSCDNVATYTVVTADGETLRASATENSELFWGLRGGGGNFGVVTEFEFRLHPTTGRVLVAELYFDAAEAAAPMRAWRDLLADAPREAMLTADVITAPEAPFLPTRLHGRTVAILGYVWVGDMDAARAWLPAIRAIGAPAAGRVDEMRYVDLQTNGDERNYHGMRHYATDAYLPELSDAAIEAFLSRGLGAGDSDADLTLMPGGGMQAYGGAIAEIGEDESAFSGRQTLAEFFGGATWAEPAEDAERMARARAWGAAMAPFAHGAYVNALSDTGDDVVRRVYRDAKMTRLSELKRRYDPDNVFHLNQNIRPSAG